MKRKALFFDIDGTLLSDHKKELPESAARVIAQARRAGHLVFINSGRARCLMQEVEAALPVDGYLCGCGTYLEIQGKKGPPPCDRERAEAGAPEEHPGP